MSRAGLRVDLYRKTTSEWRWRLWSSSSIIGQSSEGYTRRTAAIGNLAQVLGGQFRKISTPDFPKPFGLLMRETGIGTEGIPVRLVTEP